MLLNKCTLSRGQIEWLVKPTIGEEKSYLLINGNMGFSLDATRIHAINTSLDDMEKFSRIEEGIKRIKKFRVTGDTLVNPEFLFFALQQSLRDDAYQVRIEVLTSPEDDRHHLLKISWRSEDEAEVNAYIMCMLDKEESSDESD